METKDKRHYDLHYYQYHEHDTVFFQGNSYMSCIMEVVKMTAVVHLHCVLDVTNLTSAVKYWTGQVSADQVGTTSTTVVWVYSAVKDNIHVHVTGSCMFLMRHVLPCHECSTNRTRP
eukprot:scpid57410/ scgid25951/ 